MCAMLPFSHSPIRSMPSSTPFVILDSFYLLLLVPLQILSSTLAPYVSRGHICCVYECCSDHLISALCLSPGFGQKCWSFVCRPAPRRLGQCSPGKPGLWEGWAGGGRPPVTLWNGALRVSSQVLITQSAVGSGFLFYKLEPDASFAKEKSLVLLSLSQQSSENRKMSWLALQCELRGEKAVQVVFPLSRKPLPVKVPCLRDLLSLLTKAPSH